MHLRLIMHIPVLLISLVIGVHYRSASSKGVSLFAICNIICNTIYAVLTYFGLLGLVKLLLFYVSFMPNHHFVSKLYRCIVQSDLNASIKSAVIGPRGIIDDIKVRLVNPRYYRISFS